MHIKQHNFTEYAKRLRLAYHADSEVNASKHPTQDKTKDPKRAKSTQQS